MTVLLQLQEYAKIMKNIFEWSGRWGSNPRPSAWQAEALPLSYIRVILLINPPIEIRTFGNYQLRHDHSEYNRSS